MKDFKSYLAEAQRWSDKAFQAGHAKELLKKIQDYINTKGMPKEWENNNFIKTMRTKTEEDPISLSNYLSLRTAARHLGIIK